MTQRNALRPAMTAIVAVLALSSVPSFAQSAADPVVTSTPAVDVTPAPVVADPIAPADTAVAVDPVVTRTTPIAATRKTMTTSKTTVARARPAPARAATTARSVAPAAAAPVVEIPAVQALPIEPVAAAPIAAEPIAKAPATTIDLLPTAGLGGLGLLLLVGGALVWRSRRRRRLDEIEDAEWQQAAEAQAAVDAEPAPIVEPEVEPVLAEPAIVAVAATAPALEAETGSDTKFIGPETELSDNFDLSRFGPNVQDAYRGPTEDNPSASLKQRLRRANGMDQQERKLDAEVEAATGESVLDEVDSSPPTQAPAAKPAVIRHVDGDFILGRADKKPIVRPTYTH